MTHDGPLLGQLLLPGSDKSRAKVKRETPQTSFEFFAEFFVTLACRLNWMSLLANGARIKAWTFRR